MTYVILLQFTAGLVLFVAQAMYMKHLFEVFRRKVYMDVMDYVISQTKRIKCTELKQNVSSLSDRHHLHLVQNNDNKEHT